MVDYSHAMHGRPGYNLPSALDNRALFVLVLKANVCGMRRHLSSGALQIGLADSRPFSSASARASSS